MGFETTVDPAAHAHGDLARADFAKVREAGVRAAASLPDHRALLTDIYTRGFSSKGPDLVTTEAGEAPRR
jgi:tryptophan halogenase